ncbi:MAG: hypothetical protein K6357_01040 [Elusimicrobiota bacterium]
MKLKKFIFLFLAVFIFACDKRTETGFELYRQEINRIIEVNNFLPEIWPGFDLKTNKCGICFAGEGCVVFGKIDSLPKLQIKGINDDNLRVVNKNPIPVVELQKIVKIDNEDVFFINYSNGDYFFVSDFIHESFHFYQTKYFKMPDINNYSEDRYRETIVSDKSLALIILENAILAKAILDFGNRKKHISDFIAVRNYRYSFEEKKIIKWEEALERFEGSAEYIAYKVSEKLGLKRMVFLTALLDNTSKKWDAYSRFYGSGTSQIILLDDYKIDWKIKIEQGYSPFEILKECEKGEGSKLDDIFKRYDFKTMLAEARSLNIKNRNINREKSKLLEKGTVIDIENLKIARWSNLLSLHPLDIVDSSEFHNNFCDIKFLPGTQIINQLQFDFNPYKIYRILLPSDNIQILINNNRIFNSGKESFNSLDIKSPYFKFNLRKKGIIAKNGNKISIKIK